MFVEFGADWDVGVASRPLKGLKPTSEFTFCHFYIPNPITMIGNGRGFFVI